MTATQAYGPGVALALATYVVATLSPGPALLATLGTAMGEGRKAGATLALGVCCGSLTWGLLAAFGLSAVLVSWPGGLQIIRGAGGVYLLVLAWKAVRSAATPRTLQVGSGGRRSLSGHFLRGWGVQLTNPTAIISWIAMIALGVKPGAPPWVPAFVLAAAIAFAATFYTSMAVAFSTPNVVRLYLSGKRQIDAVLGAFFAFAALRLVVG